jgi:hypothetical protein
LVAKHSGAGHDSSPAATKPSRSVPAYVAHLIARGSELWRVVARVLVLVLDEVVEDTARVPAGVLEDVPARVLAGCELVLEEGLTVLFGEPLATRLAAWSTMPPPIAAASRTIAATATRLRLALAAAFQCAGVRFEGEFHMVRDQRPKHPALRRMTSGCSDRRRIARM